MNRLTRPFILFVMGVGLPAIIVSGQTARERVGAVDDGNSAVTAISARQMFDDAQAYATDKQAELEKQKTKIDEGVRAKLRKEQRELAAKFVDSLRAEGGCHLHGLREGDVAVVVALDQEHGRLPGFDGRHGR